ncbi:MAG: O-antigen ligase family protein [Chloroflexota bacterium]
MAAITGLRPSQLTFTLPARLGIGVLALLAAILTGAAAGFGISPTVLFLVLLAPFALLLMFARPHWAAVVYVAVVYADLLSILDTYHGMPPLARFAGLGLLSAVLGYRIFVQQERLVGDRTTLWMLAYGAVVALGVLYARAPDLVVSNVVEFVRNFFTFLIIINIITTSSRLHAALYALLGTGTLLASLTLFQSLTGSFENDFGGLAQYRVSDIAGSTEGARPGGTIGDANYYGQLLLILVPIALYLFFEGKSKPARLVGLACAATLAAAVVFTYSRGDAVALGAIVVATVIYKRPNPLLIAGGVLALLLALPMLPSNYLARMTTMLDIAQGNPQVIYGEDSVRGRAGATQAAIEIFADHPIFGVGRENYPLYQLEYLSGTGFAKVAKGIPPHNLYLEVAAEQGILGIVVFSGLLLTTFAALRDARRRFTWAGMKSERELTAWLAIMLIGYLVSALTLHGAFLYFLWLQISLIVALRVIACSVTFYQQLPWEYELPQPQLQATTQATSEKATRRRPRLLIRRNSATGKITETVAATVQTPTAPQRQPEYRSLPADTTGWLAAADAALQGGDAKVARAMVEMAVERDPYNAAAWTMRMRVRQAEAGAPAGTTIRDSAVKAAERAAFKAANAGPATSAHKVSEKLYNFWHENGGVPIFGCPISPYFAEIDVEGSLIDVQYFERARLEYRPQRQGTPFEIMPGRLGVGAAKSGSVAIRVPAGLDGEQVIFNSRGTGMPTPRKFFAFWEINGGPAIFGYPITPLLVDTDSEGRELAVQYFEKARLEYRSELNGTIFETQVAKLGTEVFTAKYGEQA